MNGLSHPYQLDESTFIFRGIRSIFSFLFHFLVKIIKSKQNIPRWDAAFSVCLCPIKRTPGLYGLSMPMESVNRINDRPDMSSAVNSYVKQYMKQTQMNYVESNFTLAPKIDQNIFIRI